MRARGVVGGVAGRAHVFARDAGEVAGAAFFGHLAPERGLATQCSLNLDGRAGRKRGNPRGAGSLGLHHEVHLAARTVPHVEQQAPGRPEGDRHHEHHDKPQHAWSYPHPLVSRPDRRFRRVSKWPTRSMVPACSKRLGASAATIIPKAVGGAVRRGGDARLICPLTVSWVGAVLRTGTPPRLLS